MDTTRVFRSLLIPMLVVLVFSTGQGRGADDSPGESLRRQESTQQRLLDLTERAGKHLKQITDEFERNGIEGNDVTILKAIQDVLGQLSNEHMAQIVNLLHNGRTTGDSKEAQRNVVSAYTGQKSVVVQLRQVLLEYDRQIELHDLARQVRELGDRQSANLHEALTLIAKPRQHQGTTDPRIVLQLQQSEQESVGKEVANVLKKLDAMASGFEDELEQRPDSALAFATDSRLLLHLDDAVEDLKARRLIDAAGNEKRARDALWRLARVLSPITDPKELMRESLQRLDAIIADEKEIITRTGQLEEWNHARNLKVIKNDPGVRRQKENVRRAEEDGRKRIRIARSELEQQRGRFGRKVAGLEKNLTKARATGNSRKVANTEKELRAAKAAAAGPERRYRNRLEFITRRAREALAREKMGVERQERLAYGRSGLPPFTELQRRQITEVSNQQATVIDKTDFLEQELAGAAPRTAGFLEESIPPMQNVRGLLGTDLKLGAKHPAALKQEDVALTKLLAARTALIEKIEEGERLDPETGNPMGELTDLLEKVRDLRVTEEELLEETGLIEATEVGRNKLRNNLALRQAELETAARALQEEAMEPAAEAAVEIGDAARHMASASEKLHAASKAPQEQQAAVDALVSAEAVLKKEISKLEEAAEELEMVDKILADLGALILDQQELQHDTVQEISEPRSESTDQLAARQKDLRQDTGALRPETEQTSPDAAGQLGQAELEMEKAAGSLDEHRPKESQLAQTAALQHLYEARRVLEEQRNELQELVGEALPGDLAAVPDAVDAIAQAQQDVAEALPVIDPAADLLDELKERQQAVADALPAVDDTSPLDEAHDAASDAAMKLGEANLEDAIASMDDALNILNKPGEDGAASPHGETSKEQKAIKKQTEELSAKLGGGSIHSATPHLQSGAQTIAPLAAGAHGSLPAAAQAALQSAHGSLTAAAAATAAGNPADAQAHAEAAQGLLAAAEAALSLAEAGLGKSPPDGMPGPPSSGEGEGFAKTGGPGQFPGQGDGQGAEGNPTPDIALGSGSGQGYSLQASGNQGNWDGAGGTGGPRRQQRGSSGFIGLPDRERGAVRQVHAERYPAEYGSMIEQYLKNLSDKANERN